MTPLQDLAHPLVFTILALVVGLAVGSFLNVVVYRLPRMMEREWRAQCAELAATDAAAAAGGVTVAGGGVAAAPPEEPFSLVRPRSRCPACGHPIAAWENIPVVSWLALRGRCSACRAPISPRYPVVEVLGGVAGAWCAHHFGPGLAAIGAMVFVWAILAAGLIDFDTQYLPDAITLPLLWLGLLLNLDSAFIDLKSAVIGAAAGYLSLWLIYWIFKLATGKEGMGYGDFKLLGAIGAWLGWSALPMVILLSSAVGAVVGIGLMVLARRGREVPIPFGPYLGAAGIIALFWGVPLSNLFWSRFG
jgi:leader peptidase (prepilin peptidase)/N-methyltransferase